MRLAATISILAALVLPASGAPDFSGTYLCITEAAGGLWFNSASGQWESANFKVGDKRILKLTRIGSEMRAGFAKGSMTEYTAYEVTSKDFGDETPSKCFATRGGGPVTLTGDSGWLSCSAVLDDLQVNLENGRFLAVYAVGYIDGEDSNENTPNIQGGRCSKID